MHDPTEQERREIMAAINASSADRQTLEEMYGQVWDTEQLQTDFNVASFLAPFVIVKRLSDGVRGTLEFQHDPRFYFSFMKD